MTAIGVSSANHNRYSRWASGDDNDCVQHWEAFDSCWASCRFAVSAVIY